MRAALDALGRSDLTAVPDLLTAELCDQDLRIDSILEPVDTQTRVAKVAVEVSFQLPSASPASPSELWPGKWLDLPLFREER